MKFLVITAIFTLANQSILAQPTVSELTAPTEINEGSFETYTSVIDDPLGQGLICTWDFGDGTTRRLMDRSSTGHVYTDNGTFNITLTVEDVEGVEASTSLSVTVKNVDPEIRLLKGEEDESGDKMAALEAVVHDPGDDDLLYIWQFGDLSSEEGRHMTRMTHEYAEKGVYTVRLTVEDGDGGMDTKTVRVRIDEDWEGQVSGHINIGLKGGSGLLYTKYVYDNSGELSACFKQVILYDDDARTFIVFAVKDINPLTDFSHYVGSNGPHGEMSALLWYNLPKALYNNMKMQRLPQEVLDDVLNDRSISTLMKYATLDVMPTANMDMSGTMHFTSTSGTFVTEPIEGNSFHGTFSVTLDTDDPEDSDNPPLVVHASGSFEVAINEVVEDIMQDACEDPAETFSLIRYKPRDNKENVHMEYPCIELEFSADIDMQSLNTENVQIGYFDASNTFKKAPLDFEIISASHIRVVPAGPLRSGVKYNCIVRSGNDGVKSVNRGQLDEDERWNFQTLVEPNDFRTRVYQSVYDVPLVADKEAMVRIEIFWDKPEDIADQSFVRRFPARVRVNNSGGNMVCPEKRRAIIKHYDESDAEDVRHARNSVNVYGWKPSSSDGDQIEIEVTPLYQECVPEDQRIKYKLNHAIEHWDKSPRLHVQYYFLKIAQWEDGVPPGAMAIGNEIMRKAMDFGEQMFPVRKMTSQSMGEVYVDPALYLETDETVGLEFMGTSVWNSGRFNEALRDFYFETGIHSQADVVVAFHPAIVGQGGTGGALRHFGDSDARPIPLNKRFLHMTLTEGAIPRAAIEHEIGHTFYLEHIPTADTEARRDYVAAQPIDFWEDKNGHYHIQGFRIYKDQNRGYNKSCTEGNAQHSTMANVMFPDISNVYRHHVWINKKQVLRVMDNIEVTGTRFATRDLSDIYGQSWVSLENPRPVEEKQTVYVSGRVNSATGEARITRARLNALAPFKPEIAGTYEIRVIDKDGNVAGKGYFDPLSLKSDCTDVGVPEQQSFFAQVTIAHGVEVRSLEVVHNGSVIDTYEVSATAPTVSFISPERGADLPETVELAWQGNGHEPLTYTLLYSPNGIDDWKPAGITRETSMSVNTTTLPSGESPAFRIQASDGYNVATANVAVNINFPLRLLSHIAQDTIGAADPVTVTFNHGIDPGSLNNGLFELRNTSSGEVIPGVINYDNETHVASLQPLESLITGETYIVRIGNDYSPAQEATGDKNEDKSNKPLGLQERMQAMFEQKNETTKKPVNDDSAQAEAPQNIFDVYGSVLGERVEWKVYVIENL